MAFSNYSNLFKSGLLSNDSSPLYTSHPWSAEYIGPRRGSLPGPIEQIPPPLPSAISIPETMGESIASGESFYFTFKKRRNPSVYRSFLSLDLAESQSLRSASLRGKESQEGLSSLYARVPLSRFPASIYPTTYVCVQLVSHIVTHSFTLGSLLYTLRHRHLLPQEARFPHTACQIQSYHQTHSDCPSQPKSLTG